MFVSEDSFFNYRRLEISLAEKREMEKKETKKANEWSEMNELLHINTFYFTPPTWNKTQKRINLMAKSER